jgi:SAM-dependent methyltransferase
MSTVSIEAQSTRLAPPLFAFAIFSSAALVFLVEPMIAKLILPQLGGSAAVWNTCMVFFQLCLLLGYGYAHLVQRLGSLRRQIIVHLALLALAALTLPLRVTEALGQPDPSHPIVWLLGVLAISIGAPFAVLSATAPLLQAWYARVRAGQPDAQNPYVLYAASNLGSFAALLAYPVIVEPLMRLSDQRVLWTCGYLLFVAVLVGLAWLSWRASDEAAAPRLAATSQVSWRERAVWVLLAAAPSSLMLGVTQHLSTDIASAPFLWVIPLALYLLTFVIAFQDRPVLPPDYVLFLQAIAVSVCAAFLPFNSWNWIVLWLLNLSAFFMTALMCHQALAARRPPPDRLTEFYLWLAVGGVLGGSFNALLAPLIFNTVREYPLVLVLACLARPWGLKRRIQSTDIVCVVIAVVTSFLCWALFALLKAEPDLLSALTFKSIGMTNPWLNAEVIAHLLLAMAGLAAILVRRRAVLFVICLAAISMGATTVAGRYHWVDGERSFFGVLRTADYTDAPLKSDVLMLLHGTTLHGAQAKSGPYRCHPMLYYAPTTPIGQAVQTVQKRGPANIGVVGLGTGALAAYTRPGDRITYYEIDPAVLKFAFNPNHFAYTTLCARGQVDMPVMGDARLSLQKEPENRFDILVVDAFSSDSVPTHLLTEEAMRGYLRVMKPGGVVLLHLSNRNLEIDSPAIAGTRAIGAPALHQFYVERVGPNKSAMWEASTDALIFSATPEGLKDFEADERWRKPGKPKTAPWTDDYTNLIGALWRDMTGNP